MTVESGSQHNSKLVCFGQDLGNGGLGNVVMEVITDIREEKLT